MVHLNTFLLTAMLAFTSISALDIELGADAELDLDLPLIHRRSPLGVAAEVDVGLEAELGHARRSPLELDVGAGLELDLPVVPLINRRSRFHPTRASMAAAKRDGYRRSTGAVSSVYILLVSTETEVSSIISQVNATLDVVTVVNAAVKAVVLTSFLTEIEVKLEVLVNSLQRVSRSPTPSGSAGSGCDVTSNGILDVFLAIVVDLEYTLRAVEHLISEIPLLGGLLADVLESIKVKVTLNVNILNIIFVCFGASYDQGVLDAGLGANVA